MASGLILAKRWFTKEDEDPVSCCSRRSTELAVKRGLNRDLSTLGVFPLKHSIEKDAYSDSFLDENLCLPGKGMSGTGCGDLRWTHVCEACGKPHFSPYHCERKECSECWTGWRVEKTADVVERLLSKEARLACNSARLTHVIVSSKREITCLAELNMMAHDAYAYIRKKGAYGGCCIPHLWRVTEEGKRLASDAGYKRKVWDWVRSQPNSSDYYYFAPHFHLIVYSDWLSPPEEGEEFIYFNVNKGRPMNRAGNGKKNVGGLTWYLLSHTFLFRSSKKVHSIRWFGACSYNQLHVAREKEKVAQEDLHCSLCGGVLMERWSWLRDVWAKIWWKKSPPLLYFAELKALINDGLEPEEKVVVGVGIVVKDNADVAPDVGGDVRSYEDYWNLVYKGL